MLYIIANLLSGRDKGKKALAAVEKYLQESKEEYKVFVSSYKGHSVELGRLCAGDDACTVVAVLGGDGTFNEVLNGFYPSQKPIGFIPAGTGNDFARSALLCKDPVERIKSILKKNTVKTDIIFSNKGYCLNLLGTGIDVELLLRSNKYRKVFKSSFSYYLALIITLFCFKDRDYTFKLDDGPLRTEKGFLMAFANGKYGGGGLPIATKSSINDGMLDFVLIKKLNRLRLPYLFARFLKGNLLEIDCVEHYYCKRLELTVEPSLPLNLDGELYPYEPLKAEIIAGGINMCV
ncbi:MAG: diacylglycerol kinase family lipid kinase [Clostridia bacterium]|nr:diacylglycerol kinase family lipid kinase [Clostridia bacterium]